MSVGKGKVGKAEPGVKESDRVQYACIMSSDEP